MYEPSQEQKAHTLFTRFQGNPIMTPANWPYPTNAVFNPAAAKLNDETLLLVRVEDRLFAPDSRPQRRRTDRLGNRS